MAVSACKVTMMTITTWLGLNFLFDPFGHVLFDIPLWLGLMRSDWQRGQWFILNSKFAKDNEVGVGMDRDQQFSKSGGYEVRF